ncbi:hypothetical protein HBI24_196340 [Parastagonospora nodorum]|nr:hypothetical protein HBH51_111980 [Parastagonospora nodorum]KAH5574655.1 hypothetical protein HBI24_196340 [Parastagonospora nodorum]KAH6358798.1 hypothetical protein HBI37_003380 [Parastagonospora nodorum]KAH6370158.1 hypothetical protein HBI36_027870 [Parastagonospora nodorum]KAH6468704.1 hypothetical protein HBI57_006900 [Parastagonospora nodorum]
MTTPCLSAPVLFLPQDLRSDSKLTSQITRLTNDAFRRSKLPDPDKWNYERPRFPTHESYYEMLGDETIVAVIFDQDVCAKHSSASSALESDAITNGKVVACAAAVPWKGGWAKEGAGEEDGWEIKALAVDGDAAYLRKGLAVRVMAALENRLIERTKSQQPIVSTVRTGERKDTVKFVEARKERVYGDARQALTLLFFGRMLHMMSRIEESAGLAESLNEFQDYGTMYTVLQDCITSKITACE